MLFEHGEHLAYLVIDRDDRAFVGGAIFGRNAVAIMLRRVLDLRVNGIGREVEEERFVGVSVNEFRHVVAVEIGQVGDAAIFQGSLVLVGWSPFGYFHEAAIRRTLFIGADIPFADLAGYVAGVSHELAHGGVVFGDRKSSSHAGLTVALSVHTGHEAAATGRAGWIGDVRHGALRPARGEGIDVRGRNS